MHTYKDIHVFLGSFAKLRKATFSFAMSVCPHGTGLQLDDFNGI